MSRSSLSWPRLIRSVWDRPATDTRLLPIPFSNYPLPRGERARVRVIPLPIVSLGPSIFPCGRTTKPSAPSRLLPSRVPSESQLPLPLHRTVDARGLPRMTSRGSARKRAFLLAADACLDSPQMFPRLTLASAPFRRGCLPRLAADVSPQLTPLRASPSAVDARASARMNSRSAVPGAEADACVFGQAYSHAPAPDAPANAAEGALANPSRFSHLDAPRELGISHEDPVSTSSRQSSRLHSVIPDSDRESIPGGRGSRKGDRPVALPRGKTHA